PIERSRLTKSSCSLAYDFRTSDSGNYKRPKVTDASGPVYWEHRKFFFERISTFVVPKVAHFDRRRLSRGCLGKLGPQSLNGIIVRTSRSLIARSKINTQEKLRWRISG